MTGAARPDGQRGTQPLQHEVGRAAARQALGALSGLVPIGVVAVDPDGRSWYHNQRWEDVTGCTGISFRGRPWYEAVHPDDVASVARRWDERDHNRGSLGRFRVRAADGAELWCVGESLSMFDHDGSVTALLIVVHDAEQLSEEQSLGAGGFLESILNRSEDIITILDPSLRWRWSSRGALRLVGYQAEWDADGSIFQLMHPDEADDARRALERLVASGQRSGTLEYRVKGANGLWHSMEARVEVLIDDPDVGGIVLQARDVTEWRQTLQDLEATNERLANLIASMQTAVIFQDEHRRVVLANQALVDLLPVDLTPAELEGHVPSDFGLSIETVVAEPANAAGLVDELIERRETLQNERFTTKDGRILEADLMPVRGAGTDYGFLWMFRDVTDQARAEAERERLIASEREENRRVAELEAYRSEYLASVSHEIRTPLTAIVGWTQLLRDLLSERGVGEELDALEVIERNVGRLFQLSGDLLQLESLEGGLSSLQLTEVRLDELARHAVEGAALQAQTKGVRLEARIEPVPPYEGDAGRVSQLLDILLSNALKFTDRGGVVEVRVERPTEDGRWVVEVSDTGIGIPPGEQELLFSRFFRASNARQLGIPGTGLGLPLAAAVADLHDGAISVRSRLGTGTTFRVEMRGATHPI